MVISGIVGLFALLAGLVVLSLFVGLVSLLFWVVLLPFKLLGLVFRGLAVLLFLPFMLVIGLLIAGVVGIPLLLVALVPLLPIVLLILGVVWLAKRGVKAAAVR